MRYEDIPGHEKEKKYLRKLISEDRIPHAQLFLGTKGSGHLALALAFTMHLLCQDKKDGNSCGLCSSCKKVSKFIHPDIHFAYPVVKKDGKKREETTSSDFLEEWRTILSSNPYLDINEWLRSLNVENSQANINTKECLNIIQKLGLQSFESKYKVLLLWLPEYLAKEGNRLLKLIEEPPENTVIILIAEDQEKILNTILSRCQLLYVNSFTDAEVSTYIEKKTNVDAETAKQISRLAAGNMNKAIALAHGESKNYSEALFQWLRQSYMSNPVEMTKFVNEIAGWGRENQKHFLGYGIYFFREFMFYTNTNSDKVKLDVKELNVAKKMQRIINVKKAEQLVNLFSESIDCITRNANARISFMSDSIAIGNILKMEQQISS